MGSKPEVIVVDDLSNFEMVLVAGIVIGILLTFVGVFLFEPLKAIGPIVAFGSAGILLFRFFRYTKEDRVNLAEDLASVPESESIKVQTADGICPHCGKFIGYDGNEYCTFCGNKIILK